MVYGKQLHSIKVQSKTEKSLHSLADLDDFVWKRKFEVGIDNVELLNMVMLIVVSRDFCFFVFIWKSVLSLSAFHEIQNLTLSLSFLR